MRDVVQKLGVRDQLAPVIGRVNIDLNHARVRCDGQHFQARVTWRSVAFEHDFQVQGLRRGFNCREQVKVVFEPLHGRHENVNCAGLTTNAFQASRCGGCFSFCLRSIRALRVAHLHAQCSAREPAGRFKRIGCTAGRVNRLRHHRLRRGGGLQHALGFIARRNAVLEAR